MQEFSQMRSEVIDSVNAFKATHEEKISNTSTDLPSLSSMQISSNSNTLDKASNVSNNKTNLHTIILQLKISNKKMRHIQCKKIVNNSTQQPCSC